MMNEVKKIGLAKWNTKNKWWSIPDTDVNLERIKVPAKKHSLILQVQQNNKVSVVKPRRIPTNHVDIRPCPSGLRLKLMNLSTLRVPSKYT